MKIQKFIKEEEREDGSVFYYSFVKITEKIFGFFPISRTLNVQKNIKGYPYLGEEPFAISEREYRFAKESLDKALDDYLRDRRKSNIIKTEIKEVI